MMIIGSSAIKKHYPDFPREPKDLDVLKESDSGLSKKETDEKKIEFLSNPVLSQYLKERGIYYFFKYNQSDGNTYLSPRDLLVLKISHLFWDLPNNSWDKHMFDVQFLIDKFQETLNGNFQLNNSEINLLYKLISHWETIHGPRKTSDLTMNTKEFFTNAIEDGDKHDELHYKLIKHPYFKGQQTPTYTKVLKDGCEVEPCENKFNLLTEEEKFNLCFEEVAVMSFEKGRFPSEMHWRRKYHQMLKKFIISHCTLWQGIWIIQNYKKLLNEVPFNPHQFLENATN